MRVNEGAWGVGAQPVAEAVLSAVVIGRNEGPRLQRCLESVRKARLPSETEILYVDSGSTDGSPDLAARLGAKVIALEPEWPTAALGREVGWRAASAPIVLFLDGDSMLESDFVAGAWQLFNDPRVALVWGRIREHDPRASVYHRVLALDWRAPPPGPSEYAAGNCLVRRAVLEAVGGYRTDLIAGEDAELCRRIRAHGWLVWHSPDLMVRHDLAMTTLTQYVRRCFRTGYSHAMVEGPDLPGRRRLARTNRVWGSLLLFLLASVLPATVFGGPAAALASGCLLVASLGWACWKARRKTNDLITLVLYALHSHAKQIPLLAGQLTLWWDRHRGYRRKLIEYRRSTVRRRMAGRASTRDVEA